LTQDGRFAQEDSPRAHRPAHDGHEGTSFETSQISLNEEQCVKLLNKSFL